MTDEPIKKKGRELRGMTIEIQGNVAKFIPEEKTEPWWRKGLNREKDGFVFQEMNQDIDRIVKNLTKDGPDGKRLGKYDVVLKTLPAKPKSSQGASKTEYQKTLIEQLKKSGEDFTKFRNKEILVYICVYLREEKYKTHDVDNFIKAIIDALKPFIGDDSGVVTVIAEKKPIRNYQEEDLDFLEQVFVVVTTPEAKADILA